MTVWEWTLVAALGYLIGGSLVGWKKRWPDQGTKRWLAVGTGLLWAVVFGGMLPHGWTEVSYPPVWILTGLMSALVFQQVFGKRRQDDHITSSAAVWSVFTGMGIHAFFEGVALGAGFQTDLGLGLAVLLGLTLHKVPEGMAMASVAMARGDSRKNVLGTLILLGVCTAAGTGMAWLATGLTRIETGGPLLFSAGIPIYITGTELWPKVNEQGNRRSIGWVLSGMLIYGLLNWGSQLLYPVHFHDHPTAEAADAHTHHGHPISPAMVPEGDPVPEVRLEVEPDVASGWNIHVHTSHFQFTPDQVNRKHQPGTGHAHLYVNGKKKARLYGPWYHLGSLPPGTHTIRVELNNNQHAPYVVDGKRIGDQVTIRVRNK